MKFGKYLKSQIRPEFADYYVDYGKLKDVIAALAQVERKDDGALTEGESGFGERVTSLAMAPNMPESAKFEGRDITEADFFNMLESEMKKIDDFTFEKVKQTMRNVEEFEQRVKQWQANGRPADLAEPLRAEAQRMGDSFLMLEKYANLNYLAIHKILKKHDKSLPIPCRRFYIMRLSGQRWVKHDYSKIFVRLSQIHGVLRGDDAKTKEDPGAGGQEFIRTTKKYWVRTEDISRVKHIVLQNLPIFQHDIESLVGDSQLTNSVYFDNAQLELYHGRLDKTPGAIAIRFRWYATEDPDLVFVERKTHRESWTGEVSVKERFTLNASQVLPFLEGTYTVEAKIAEMISKKKSQADIDNVTRLFREIYEQIDTKQLRPCMRTRYNRTAYQIPFDATVRISLDTNLTMIAENPRVGPDCASSGRWYRDPNLPLPPTEITRFPHAILEVKLAVKEGSSEPKWVTDLIGSGMVTEVHKFSKFIHGCATLLTESVRAVPYWIDDPSIRPSIMRSRVSQPLKQVVKAHEGVVESASSIARRVAAENGNGGDSEDEQEDDPLFAGARSGKPIELMRRKPSLGGISSPGYGAVNNNSEATPLLAAPRHQNGNGAFLSRVMGWGSAAVHDEDENGTYLPRKVPMKVEPKVFLANERTMLSWLNMSVTLGTISAGLLALNTRSSALVGMLLLPLSVLFAIYALFTFYWRAKGIAQRSVDQVPFHDVFGPSALALALTGALTAVFFIHVFGSATPGA